MQAQSCFADVRPHAFEEIVDYHIETASSLICFGDPGVGKTTIIDRRAKDHGYEVIYVDTSTAEPTDIQGMPWVFTMEDGTKVTEWAVQRRIIEGNPKKVIFFDEYAKGPQAVLNATGPVFLEKRWGTVQLPPETVVIGATNRLENKAGDGKIPRHLTNRVTCVGLSFHIDDFRNYGIDKGWEHEFLAFSAFKPDAIFNFDPTREVNATPRQWEWVQRHFKSLSTATRSAVISGRVGPGPAAEFEAFLRVVNEMPSIDGIILDPKGSPVPAKDRPDVMYAVAGALAARANGQNFDAIYEYTERLPKTFSVLCVRDAYRRNPKELRKCAAFGKWSVKNADVMLSA